MEQKQFTADDMLKAADAAIDLFLEYRDKHGRDEGSARAAAIRDMSEGIQAMLDFKINPDDPRL